MRFHPPVPQFAITPVLDPLWLVVFALLFFGSAALAIRRPAYAIGLLVLATPFTGAHAIAGTTLTIGKAVLLGMLTGLAAARRLPAVPRALAAAFAALIAIDALTGIDARFRIEVARETLKWIEYAAYAFAVWWARREDGEDGIPRAAFAVAALAVCASALIELWTGAPSDVFVRGVLVPRIAGALGGPNQLGGYLEIAIAVLAAWQVRASNRLGALALFIAGCALLLSYSRSALVATCAAIAAIALLSQFRIARLWPLLAGVGSGFLVALAGDGLGAGALLGVLAGARESDTNAAISGGVGSRAELWRAAWQFFRAHPLLGVGAGNYQYELAGAGLPGVRTEANEWYLQSLAEGGILFFAALLAWIAAVLRGLARAPRTGWRVAALAATAAMLLHGFTDDLIFYPQIADTWMIAIALGCAG